MHMFATLLQHLDNTETKNAASNWLAYSIGSKDIPEPWLVKNLFEAIWNNFSFLNAII